MILLDLEKAIMADCCHQILLSLKIGVESCNAIFGMNARVSIAEHTREFYSDFFPVHMSVCRLLKIQSHAD
jgi:hypothetical protein